MSTHHHTQPDAGHGPTDLGFHNMFAFGRDTVFLSHLPMFMAPHDAQLILEASLENADGSLDAVWSSERERHPGERMYTIAPEEFTLSSLYAPDPPERDSFRARFFRGHLERGGQVIPELAKVTVRIKRVIYAHRLDDTEGLDDLTYLLVGRGAETFLVHKITTAPDFDQIVSVRLVRPRLSEDELERGVAVVFPGRANTAGERVREGTLTAQGHVTGAHQFLEMELTDLRELYFEEGELASPDASFSPTRLEQEAGFD